MLSQEQIKLAKENLLQQIDAAFPEGKREEMKNQINSMNDSQFEEFLKNQGLIQSEGKPIQTQCIFCSIISGNTSSYKINENEKAIAVLEINPISHGHAIIIPKEHILSSKKMPPESMQLAQEIEKTIKEKLNPKNVLIKSSNVFGHEIINVIPIYENETLDSKRKKISPEELEELQKHLTIERKEKPPEEIKEEIINEENTWLPKRIP
jgi:diadenosine tetraphosphate (Ap4A) HIT family hydrolase